MKTPEVPVCFYRIIFFPTFPKFFKDKHRLLVGGL